MTQARTATAMAASRLGWRQRRAAAGDKPAGDGSAAPAPPRPVEKASSLVWWLIGYVALYLIRPWEIMRPEWSVVPWERIYALAMLARFFFRPAQARWGGLGACAATYLGALGVCVILAVEPLTSVHTYEEVLRTSIFAACLAVGIRTRADLRWFVLGWIGVSYFYQAKALYEFFAHGRGIWRMGLWRLIGIEDMFGDPNTFAATTYLLLPFVIELFFAEKKRWVKLWLLSEVGLALAVIVLTGSRGAILAAGLLAVVAVVFSKHPWSMLGLATVAIVLTVLFLPPAIRERYKTILDSKANESATESAEGRILGLKKGVTLFGLRPLQGVGPGCFIVADNYFQNVGGVPGLQPHNIAGQILGETGLLGTLTFLILIATLFGTLWRIRGAAKGRDDDLLLAVARAGLILIALLFFNGTSGHNLYRYNWYWLVGLGIAMQTIDRPLEARAPRPPRRGRGAGTDEPAAPPERGSR